MKCGDYLDRFKLPMLTTKKKRSTAHTAPDTDRITVFFRYDDFSETSPRNIESGILQAFRKYGLPCSMAVIPAVTTGGYRNPSDVGTVPLSANTAAFVRDGMADGTIDVLLHGLHHRTLPETSPHSEFGGLDIQSQRRKLESGRAILADSCGVYCTVFVPPWNTYDNTTLKALADLGFHAISANRFCSGESADGLSLVPITADFGELRAAVARARKYRGADPVIGVLLHPYDFSESGDPRARTSLDALRDGLSWLTAQADVVVADISGLAAQRQRFSLPRYRANAASPLEGAFPSFVGRTEQFPVYLGEVAARRRRAWRHAAFLGLQAVLLAVGAILAESAWRVVAAPMAWPVVPSLAALLPIGLAFGLAFRSVRNRSIGARAATAMSLLMGAAAGLLLA